MKLKDLLVCSVCKSKLVHSKKYLTCTKCRKRFDVVDGIPILVDLENLPEHLNQQIHYFADIESLSVEYTIDPWQQSYVSRFNTVFDTIKPNSIIVDSGTGSGYMAIELAKRGFTVIALDLTIKSLIRLKKVAKQLKLDKYIYPVCCTAEELPLKNKSADYVLCNALLEHLPKEKEAIQEISRIAKKSSGLMITVPLSYKYLHPLFLPVNYIHDFRIGHLRRYDSDIIKKKFSRAGFNIKKVFYTGHFAKVFLTLFSMLFGITSLRRFCEFIDEGTVNEKVGASNITAFLVRGKK